MPRALDSMSATLLTMVSGILSTRAPSSSLLSREDCWACAACGVLSQSSRRLQHLLCLPRELRLFICSWEMFWSTYWTEYMREGPQTLKALQNWT